MTEAWNMKWLTGIWTPKSEQSALVSQLCSPVTHSSTCWIGRQLRPSPSNPSLHEQTKSYLLVFSLIQNTSQALLRRFACWDKALWETETERYLDMRHLNDKDLVRIDPHRQMIFHLICKRLWRSTDHLPSFPSEGKYFHYWLRQNIESFLLGYRRFQWTIYQQTWIRLYQHLIHISNNQNFHLY